MVRVGASGGQMTGDVVDWVVSGYVAWWLPSCYPCPECRMRIYVFRNRGSFFICPLASGGKAVRFGKVKCKPLQLYLTPAWDFFPLILICKVIKISLQGQQYALVALFQGYQLIPIILKDLDRVDNSEDHIDPLHQWHNDWVHTGICSYCLAVSPLIQLASVGSFYQLMGEEKVLYGSMQSLCWH